MTSNFNVNDGINPTYDVGDTFVTKSYAISAYHNMNIAIKAPKLISCGYGTNGELANSLSGSTNKVSSPTQVGALTNWKYVAMGDSFGAAVKTDGTLWTWGSNTNGQLGQNNTTSISSPLQVAALTTWKQVSCGYKAALAVKSDGTLWGSGRNVEGQLGLAGAVTTLVFTQVGALNNWKQTAMSYSSGGGNPSGSAAVKTDGTLWTWGVNSSGQLGQSDIINRSSPTQVVGSSIWKYVSMGTNMGAAVRTDGTLWMWGGNGSGQLGQFNTANASTPVQVGAMTNWKSVACGYNSTMAIKTDGTLWSWGQNSAGQLGQLDVVNRSSPVQVGLMTNWKYVSTLVGGSASSTMAVKTDGTLWAWGGNTYGNLGQTDTVSRSSPTQVGALTNWKYVSPMMNTAVVAIAESGGW